MENLKTFKEKVEYLNKLIDTNIEKAKEKNTPEEKEEAVFHKLNIKSDGNEINFHVDEDECVYTVTKEQVDEKFKLGIEKHAMDSEEFMIYAKAVIKLQRLAEYSIKEITFEKFAGIDTTPLVVKEILKQKNNISEQLKLLRSNRNLLEVQDYIDNIYNDKYCSKYVKYFIDKYYYNKKGLVKPKKNGLESFGKILLN